jgi:hypothetical protein
VHRRRLVQLMQQYTRLKEDAGDDELSLVLVVDAELFRLDAMIRWLDDVDGRLKRMPPGMSAPTSPAMAQARTAPERLRRKKAVRG